MIFITILTINSVVIINNKVNIFVIHNSIYFKES